MTVKVKEVKLMERIKKMKFVSQDTYENAPGPNPRVISKGPKFGKNLRRKRMS